MKSHNSSFRLPLIAAFALAGASLVAPRPAWAEEARSTEELRAGEQRALEELEKKSQEISARMKEFKARMAERAEAAIPPSAQSSPSAAPAPDLQVDNQKVVRWEPLATLPPSIDAAQAAEKAKEVFGAYHEAICRPGYDSTESGIKEWDCYTGRVNGTETRFCKPVHGTWTVWHSPEYWHFRAKLLDRSPRAVFAGYARSNELIEFMVLYRLKKKAFLGIGAKEFLAALYYSAAGQYLREEDSIYYKGIFCD